MGPECRGGYRGSGGLSSRAFLSLRSRSPPERLLSRLLLLELWLRLLRAFFFLLLDLGGSLPPLCRGLLSGSSSFSLVGLDELAPLAGADALGFSVTF